MSTRRKLLRYLLVFAGLLVVIGALVAVKFLQISSLMAMGEEMQQAGPPPEPVGSAKVKKQSWEGTLSAVGTVAGARSVEVSNDAPGRVKRIRFESGATVKQRQVLVELDTSVERAQLASAKSRRSLAEINVKRSRALVQERVAPKSQLDTHEAELQTAKAEVAGLQAQIDKKIVRAPFSGRLGIRSVDVGQYLNPGTTLTTLEALGEVFVDFTLPQQAFGQVKEGMPVRIKTSGPEGVTLQGTISAVAPKLDEVTHSLKLRASVSNQDDKLRPGMFVDVTVVLPKRGDVLLVPQTAVVHASYGDSVFVIEDKPADEPGMRTSRDGKPVKVARQHFVKLGEARGDFVAIVKGVTEGQEVVSAGAFKLKNGAPIVIDNTVKPEPKLNPTPENR